MKPIATKLPGLALILALAGAVPVLPSVAPVHAAEVAPAQVARVAEQVRRAEAVRAIKRLQHAYVHYLHLGLWDEAASLFASDGALGEGPRRIVGKEAIAAHLREKIGGGADGMPHGRLFADMIFSPVVTLEPSGLKGKGRWHGFGIDAQFGEKADWFGTIHENVYVLEDGKWKFAMLHPYPIFAGPYEEGWKNADPVLRAVPFHFDVNTLGLPSTKLQDGWTPPVGAAVPPLAELERRVARLNDESQIERLQNAYGYYVDRRLWDDVADLFAPDGVMESGADKASGRRAIRAALEAIAPADLKPGELNDHLQFDMVVTIAADGLSASARGLQLGMVGRNGGPGAWTLATFENLYVKRDGKWTFAHMRVFPRARTDYPLGWAKSAVPDAPFGRAGRAVPARQAALQYPGAAFPAFSFANPVTGAATAYPAGLAILPVAALPAGGAAPADAGGDPAGRLAEIERQLAVASAYDGAENVSTAYGYYIDEFLWRPIGDLFSSKGWKELSYVGTYVGNERVFQSLARRYGNGGRFVPSMAIHQKMQPVTTVAPDGRSARIHLRLFQLGTSNNPGGAQIGGHYENGAIIENGIWKISGMDLDYVWTGNLKTGWTYADPATNTRNVPSPDVMKDYPPDGPLRGPSTAPWPDMLPVALHFRNPVSGREPPLLLPDKGF